MSNKTGHLYKLSLHCQNYQQGSGGSVELTPADIAAVVGSIQGQLQPQLLCLMHCPDMARQGLIVNHINLELLAHYYQQRLTELTLFEKQVIATDNGELNAALRAGERLKQHKASMFPKPGDGKYPKLINAVLHEWTRPQYCANCKGQGRVIVDRAINCCACGGTGKDYNNSDAKRAKQLGIHKSTYQKSWSGIYNRAMAIVVDVYGDALHQYQQQMQEIS